MPARLPLATLDTLFLDAGNTLVSVDFLRVAGAVEQAGVECSRQALRRAEAAARPALSQELGQGHSTEAPDSFTRYLAHTLRGLPATAGWEPEQVAALAAQLAPELKQPGRADLLWNEVMPGVPEALERLAELGLRLVVVSNSDGTVERTLEALGLRTHFDQVVDSQLVGIEKPDPRIFEHALERCGADPRRTLHVGDLYHVDVVGARAAGIHPLLVDPWGDWPEPDCARVADLLELAVLLEELR